MPSMNDEENEQDACGNCGYETRVEEYCHGHPRRTVLLCDVCAMTRFSLASEYPRQVADTVLYKSLAFAFNMVLDELRDIKAQLAALQEDAHDGHPDNAHV